jgi:hypothetical protein
MTFDDPLYDMRREMEAIRGHEGDLGSAMTGRDEETK